jgi:sugar phosphate isomerase/epimerase
MQSIWYGRNEKLFGTEEERIVLIDYTKKAVDFAESIGCKNIVFGCPRNREMPNGADERIAIDFFKEVGAYAARHGTVIGIEANPPIYNTNYINDTSIALDLIEKIDSVGIKLNLDIGTMIENGEDVNVLNERERLINHVHISEPGLKPIMQRQLHYDLVDMLMDSGYEGYVSIEVGMQESINCLEKMMQYVKKVFGDN